MKDEYLIKNSLSNLPFAIKKELTTDHVRMLRAGEQSVRQLAKDCSK